MKIKIINRQCWVGEPSSTPYGMALYAWDMDNQQTVHCEVHTTQIEDPEWCILPKKNVLEAFIDNVKERFPNAEIICDVDAVN